MAGHLLPLVLSLLLGVNLVTAIAWDFQFGKRVPNDFLSYEKEGEGEPGEALVIPIKLGVRLTYTKLTLWTVAPPDVRFDWETSTFSFAYPWSKSSPIEKYKIQAYGVLVVPPSPSRHG